MDNKKILSAFAERIFCCLKFRRVDFSFNVKEVAFKRTKPLAFML